MYQLPTTGLMKLSIFFTEVQPRRLIPGSYAIPKGCGYRYGGQGEGRSTLIIVSWTPWQVLNCPGTSCAWPGPDLAMPVFLYQQQNRMVMCRVYLRSCGTVGLPRHMTLHQAAGDSSGCMLFQKWRGSPDSLGQQNSYWLTDSSPLCVHKKTL